MDDLCQLCSYLTVFAHFLAFNFELWITFSAYKILTFSCRAYLKKITFFFKENRVIEVMRTTEVISIYVFQGQNLFFFFIYVYMGYVTGMSFWEKTFTTWNTHCSAKKKEFKLLNNCQQPQKVGKATEINQNQLHILSMKQCFFCCKIFLE